MILVPLHFHWHKYRPKASSTYQRDKYPDYNFGLVERVCLICGKSKFKEL